MKMEMPRVVYRESQKKDLDWNEILDYFKIDEELRPELTEKFWENNKSDGVVFHLNRFIRLINENLNADDGRVDVLCNISCILESLNSPLVPVVQYYGFDFEEWKREKSPVEYWSIYRVVRECGLAYAMVGEELQIKRKYTKGDIYDMLCDLVSLGRVYSFKDIGSKGVFKKSIKGERESFYRNFGEVEIKVHTVKYPKPLVRVDDLEVEVVR